MRVVEGGGGSGLTLETGQSLGIGGEVLGEHLDGDITVELRIPRPIHLSHAALTERFKDLVMTEGFADQDAASLPGGNSAGLYWEMGNELQGREDCWQGR